MARQIAPRPVGDIIDLRGPRTTMTATAPDGLQVRIPAPTGKVRLWLAQAGDWQYVWENGPSGTITVYQPEPEPAEHEPLEAADDAVPAAFTYGGR